MAWEEIDRNTWEGLAQAAPLQQTWRWGDVLADAGARVERRVAQGASNAAIGLAQVVTRAFGVLSVSLVSRGPVWLGPAGTLGGLRHSLEPAWPRIMLITPETGALQRAIPVYTPAWHAELDIRPPLESLRLGLDPKLRNKISRAEREGLYLRRDDKAPDRYAWLLEAEAQQQRERGYRNWPPGMVNAWCRKSGEVRVFVARDGGTRLAAMLFLVHGRVATYHIGWTGPEGRRAAAHPLCLWRAIRDLKTAGIERIDLGTVNTEDARGLARFKIATGAFVRPLGATNLVLPGGG